MERKFVIFFLLLLGEISANPFRRPSECGPSTCREHNSKFTYVPGTAYRYHYEADVVTSLSGTSQQESRLHLQADVYLEVLSTCEMALRLDYVSLEDSDPDSGYRSQSVGEDIFQKALQEYPLRFSFQDGLIEEICPNEQEAQWVLNIKRGILSSLQNSMRRFDLDEETKETDISGHCTVKYQFMGPSLSSNIIHKTKDISSCTERYGHISVLQATPYIFSHGHQSLPVIHSTSTCKQTVTSNRLSRVECEEMHLFQPFSNGNSGAVTKIMQTLDFVSEENKLTVYREHVASRSSLLFQHQYGHREQTDNLHTVKEALNDLCKVTSVEVQPDSPQKFAVFIHRLQELSYDSLTQFSTEVHDICSLGRKHFEDALPLVGTGAAVAVIRDIIETAHENNQEITTAKANTWLTSIALISRPDVSTIMSATPFLKWREPLPQALLSVSTLVHTFCRQNPGCETEKAVKDVMSLLESNLGTDCSARYREEKDEMVLTLRAIGNLGTGTSSLSRVLTRCFQNKQNAMEVRVAALDAFRRIPCETEYLESVGEQDALLNEFTNLDEDTELRITAYLAIMRCPNYRVIERIKTALQNEEVNQVGSFVWTHLSNIQETSIPSKAEIQSLLADYELQKKFSIDLRKFSRNYEVSMFFDRLNTGASLESNVIFSTESYLPRSAMVNLTVDLFGESINIFEIGTRIEGFENYLESVFGPNGYMKNDHVHDILGSFLQHKRSINKPNKHKLEALSRRFNAINKYSEIPEASVFLRTFGNEIHYTHLQGMDEIQSAVRDMNPLEFFKKVTAKSSEGEGIKYRKSLLFLDSSYIIPTAIGLPLNLTALGSAVVNIRLAGSLKADNFQQNRELEVQGEFHPSVSVDISGAMSVDAYVARTGLKLKSSLHSSTAVDANLKIKGKKLVNMKLNLPKDKQEILNIKTELFVEYRKLNKELKGITDGRVDYQKCSGRQLDQALGISICGKLQYVNATLVADAPSFPLTGAAAVSLYLEKKDPNIEGYVFEYNWDSDEEQTVFSVKFDTPGSLQDRVVSCQLDVSRASKSLSLIFQSPGNKLETKGKYQYENTKKELDVSVSLNGKEKFRTAAQLLLEGDSWNGKKAVLKPSFQLFIGQQKTAELKGVIEIFTKETSTYDHNLEFNCPLFSAKVTGQTTKNDASYTLDLEVQYKLRNERKWENIKFQSELSKVSTKSLIQYEASMRHEFSAFPKNNFLGVWEFQKAAGHMKNKIDINWSPNVNDERNKLTLLQILTYYTTYESIKLNSILQVKQPSGQLDLLVGLDYRATDTNLDTSLTMRYAPEKEIRTSLALKQHFRNLVFVEGNWNLSLPSLQPLQVSGRLDEQTSGQYKVTMNGIWVDGNEIKLSGLYYNKDTRRKLSRDLQLTIMMTGFQEIGINGNLLLNETNFKARGQGSCGQDKYSLAFQYQVAGQGKHEFNSELICKDLTHSLHGNMVLDEGLEAQLDLHLDDMRDIHLEASFKEDGYAKDVKFETKWDVNRDPHKKLFVDLKLQFPHENQQGLIVYSGDLVFSYPGKKVISHMEGQGEENGNQNLVFTLEWKPGKELNLKGTLKSAPNVKVIAVELLTPFSGWKKNSFSALYNTSAGIHTALNALWKEKEFMKFDFTGGYSIDSTRRSRRIFALGKFDSTVPGYEKMLITLDHKVHQQIESKIEIQYGPTQKIIISSMWELSQYYGQRVDGTVTIDTPIDGYRNIVFKGSLHRSQKFQLDGRLTVESESYGSFEILREVPNPNEYKWDIIVETPLIGSEPVAFQLEYNYDWSEYSGRASLQWPGGNVIKTEGTVKYDRYNGFKGHNIKILTPYSGYETIIFLSAWEDELLQANLNWGEEKNIGFTTNWKIYSQTDFMIRTEVYTPFKGYATNRVTAKYQFYPKNQKWVDLDFTLTIGTEQVGVIGGIKETKMWKMNKTQHNWEGEMNVNLHVTSLGFKASFADESTEEYQSSEAAASIAYNGIQICEAKGTVQISDSVGFRTVTYFIISNPTEEYSAITSEFMVEMKSLNLFKFAGDVILNEKDSVEIKKLGFTLEYETNNPASNEVYENHLVLGLRTPIAEYRDINIDIFLRLKPEVNSVLMIRLNEKEITLEGALKSTFTDLWQTHPGSLLIEGSVKGSVSHSRPVKFSLLYVLELEEENQRVYTLEVKKQFIDEKAIKLQVSTEMDKKIWSWPVAVAISLSTPFQPFLKTEFSGKIKQHSKENWDISINVMWNDKDVNMAGQLHFDGNSFPRTIQGTLTTPFSVLREAAISGTLKKKDHGFQTTSSLQWDNRKIELNAEYKNLNDRLIELNAEAITPFENFRQFFFIWKMNSANWNDISGSLNIRTPFENYLKNIIFNWEYQKENEVLHIVKASYDTEDASGSVNGEVNWGGSWEDFGLKAELSMEIESKKWKKHATIDTFYKNLDNDFTDFTAGFDMSVDKPYLEFGINGTLKRNPGKSSNLVFNLKTPSPEHEIYTVKGIFEFENPSSHALYKVDYSTAISEAHYAINAMMDNAQGNFDGILSVSWDRDKKLSGHLRVQYEGSQHITGEFTLITPLFIEDTFHLAITYNRKNDEHVTGRSIYDGTVVFTWPVEQMIKLILHHENLQSTVTVQTPWKYTEDISINYAHKESHTDKECMLGFKIKNVLIFEIKKVFSSRSSAGLETEMTVVEIKNHFWPLGIAYNYKYEYSGGFDGLNLPTRVTRTVDLYDLTEHSKKLTGELKIRTTDTGKEIILSAIHPYRKLQFVTGYDFLDHQFKHKTEFSWKANSKITYEIEIVNKSKSDATEHDVLLKIMYPLRTIVLNGHFKVTEQTMVSSVEVSWDPKNEDKRLGASVTWVDDSKTYYNDHKAVISFKHPFLAKDIQFISKYYSDQKDWFNVKMELDYAPDPQKKVSVAAVVKHEPDAQNNHQEALLTLQHPESDLDLKVIHTINSDEQQHEQDLQLVYHKGFGLAQTAELKTRLLWLQKQLEIELKSPYDKMDLSGKLQENEYGYKLTGEAQRKGEAAKYAQIQINTENPYLLVDVYYDPELQKSMHLKGGVPDMRNVVFNLWREAGQIKVSDITSYLRLNHSHLLTSYLKWRPTLWEETVEGVLTLGKDMRYQYENFVDETTYLAQEEAAEAALAIWEDILETLTPLVKEIRGELLEITEDGERLQVFFNSSYHRNDFHMKYLINMGQTYYKEFEISDHLTKLMEYLADGSEAILKQLGMYGEGIKYICTDIKDMLKDWYYNFIYTMNTEWYGDGSSIDFTLLLEEYAEAYNQFMKNLHWKSKQFFDKYGVLVSSWLEKQFAYWIHLVGPTYLKFLDWLDVTVWDHMKEILDLFYDKHEMLLDSLYLQKLYSLGQDLDELYNDLMNKNAGTIIKKYWNMLLDFLSTKYSNIDIYRHKMSNLQRIAFAKWKEIRQNDPVKSYLNLASEICQKLTWIYNYIDIEGKLWNAFVLLYNHGGNLLTQTTLEAKARYTEAKTLFIVDPAKGLIAFEQKLPIPWEAFNQEPKWEKLLEYQVFLKLKGLSVSSEGSIWDIYYEYKPDSDIYNWIPPFKAQGLIAGPKHIMTFQKKFYSFAGYCEYVLASDFVNGNFTLIIKYTTRGSSVLSYVISLVTEDDIFQFDFLQQTLKTSRNGMHRMPVQIGQTVAYVEGGKLFILNPKGFNIECNIYYEVCTVTLSGWHYGKTGGMLGTMDNEWRTDFKTPDHNVETQVEKFAKSWEVSHGTCTSEENIAASYHKHDQVVCKKFFKSHTTELGGCFNHVDPTDFFLMCQKASARENTKDVCQAAQSYVEACKMEGIPVRIPSYCIKCDIRKGEAMSEYDYRDLEGKDVPHSTDVVFIVELKECNRDLWERRRIKTIMQALNKEFTKKGIIMNKYAVVAFGGNGVFDKPRHIFSSSNKKFTIGQEIHHNLHSLPIGNGSHDVFDAIRFAANMNFRAGVSKTFILLPCSSCDPESMSVDYSVLHRVMLENAITLHVLMSHSFNFKKNKVEKYFYGIDGSTAYTVKDKKKLTGNPALRRQVKLPKSVLGYCTPLALETNGTVFNALKLEEKKSKNPKRFAIVFAKRIAKTAEPSPFQTCECSSNSAGTGILQCYPSVYPKTPYIDYSFEIDALPVKQVQNLV